MDYADQVHDKLNIYESISIKNGYKHFMAIEIMFIASGLHQEEQNQKPFFYNFEFNHKFLRLGPDNIILDPMGINHCYCDFTHNEYSVL